MARLDKQGLPIIGSVASGLAILAGFFALVTLFFIAGVGLGNGNSPLLDGLFFSFVSAMVVLLISSIAVTWHLTVPLFHARFLAGLGGILGLTSLVAALVGSYGVATLALLALIASLLQLNLQLPRRVATGLTPF